MKKRNRKSGPTISPKTEGKLKREIARLNRMPIECPFNPEKWLIFFGRIAPAGRQISKRNWAIKRLVEKIGTFHPSLRYLIPDILDLKVLSNESTPKLKVSHRSNPKKLDDQQLVELEIIKAMRLANSKMLNP